MKKMDLLMPNLRLVYVGDQILAVLLKALPLRLAFEDTSMKILFFVCFKACAGILLHFHRLKNSFMLRLAYRWSK
jgi:hypothetical protein